MVIRAGDDRGRVAVAGGHGVVESDAAGVHLPDLVGVGHHEPEVVVAGGDPVRQRPNVGGRKLQDEAVRGKPADAAGHARVPDVPVGAGGDGDRRASRRQRVLEDSFIRLDPADDPRGALGEPEFPSAPAAMEDGALPPVGIAYSIIAPLVEIRPMALVPCSRNQSASSGPATMAPGLLYRDGVV